MFHHIHEENTTPSLSREPLPPPLTSRKGRVVDDQTLKRATNEHASLPPSPPPPATGWLRTRTSPPPGSPARYTLHDTRRHAPTHAYIPALPRITPPEHENHLTGGSRTGDPHQELPAPRSETATATGPASADGSTFRRRQVVEEIVVVVVRVAPPRSCLGSRGVVVAVRAPEPTFLFIAGQLEAHPSTTDKKRGSTSGRVTRGRERQKD